MMSFVAISNAELNCEINAYPDEQDSKIDRYDVERPDHEQTKGRRRCEADHQVDDERGDKAPRSQREPEDEENDRYRGHAVANRILLDRAELLVIDRHRPGETHRRLVFRLNRPRQPVNRRLGLLAGLDRVEVEKGTHLEKAKRFVGRSPLSLRQKTPRKTRGSACQDVVQAVRHQIQWTGKVLELETIGLEPEQRILESRHQASQTSVLGDIVDHGLPLDETVECGSQVSRLQKQKTVPGKKSGVAGVRHGLEQGLL